MKNKKIENKYYKALDLLRVFSCLAVLLYHLNILSGGFLAVCSFFVLSGYLSCISANKKDKFSLKTYYWNRFKKIYLPLLVVVFLTVGITSLFSNVSWLNLKPETTSVLLGYNNFWQLSVNLDYFARHISSPFMHFWYIGILLQFEIVFPFIYMFFKKLKDKYGKNVPSIISLILTLASFAYFCFLALSNNIMGAYYNTFARAFSLLFGVSIGFIHINYRENIAGKLAKRNYKKNVIPTYLFILIILFIITNANSKFYVIGMLLTTIITGRIIDYSIVDTKKENNLGEKIIKSLSSICYLVYLVQYPIIFLCQEFDLNNILTTIIVIILAVIISFILNFVLNFKNKTSKLKGFWLIINIFLVAGVCFGIYKYVTTRDYTADMKVLEQQLEKNSKLLLENQEEYQKRLEKEEAEWLETLGNLEYDEDKIKEEVAKLPVVGIGDSVMLGAVDELKKQFKNGYFDAAISRTAWKAGEIIDSLKSKKMLGNPVIINMGANGDCNRDCKVKIMKKLGDKKVLWLTNTNKKTAYVNENLKEFAKEYDNLTIVDWNELSKNHPEYFIVDGIHLTPSGKKAYTQTIYEAVCEVYINEYKLKREEAVREHEQELKKKITFWGKDTILNLFSYIKDDFNDAKFVVDESLDYVSLSKEIKKYIEENKLNHRVVLALDSYLYLSVTEYHKLIEELKDYELYIIFIKKNNYDNLEEYDNVKIIDFYQEIKNNDDYLRNDGFYLSDLGNKRLQEILKEVLN